jgi:hypothetical protein
MAYTAAQWKCARSRPQVHAKLCRASESLQAQLAWLQYANTEPHPPELLQYLAGIYRFDELEKTTLRLRTSELRYFWSNVPGRMQVNVTWACASCALNRLLHSPSLFAPHDEASLNPHLIRGLSSSSIGSRRQAAAQASYRPSQLTFPGFFVYRHEQQGSSSSGSSGTRGSAVGVRHHTLVEVMRVARLDDKPAGSAEASTRHQIFYWLAPGSGIWLDVGVTMVLSGEAAEASLPGTTCRDARLKGFDTIQRLEAFGGFSSELVDCREPGVSGPRASREAAPAEEGRWEGACPPVGVQLWAGLPTPPRRHAPWLIAGGKGIGGRLQPCVCDPALSFLNCKGGPPRTSQQPYLLKQPTSPRSRADAGGSAWRTEALLPDVLSPFLFSGSKGGRGAAGVLAAPHCPWGRISEE